MSKLVEYAKVEFEKLGWPGDDEMQGRMCDNIVEMLTTFSKQGHSGHSAQYLLNIFDRLVRFKTLTPLTGEDDEWEKVSENVGDNKAVMYQNKRDASVFKEVWGDGEDDSKTYFIDGIVFVEKDGDTYTDGTRLPVEFPWIRPERIAVNVHGAYKELGMVADESEEGEGDVEEEEVE